ncbi:hypothetical protein PFICI_10762 [Pestalotiopsis fici W106-1]|uniref:Zn(2)-C6 fungal-type domain-containing protein n=1 Tax=Pestalotiopsis fici (strain W106-1 / CGMCC3.15140) TaxID=1229662 RepID=W3WSP5_PESFW|nr:uncharacterized protein PFICI_10762 [Pestalotiopsis fici W106-1]ETS76888.1 hypothetical protein PFICI_10762 [Pestalotiopsis fici W106-1]
MATAADGSVEYWPCWHQASRLMLPVVTTGALLSSVSSAPADQEIGIDVGYQCEPTMGPGGRSNLLGGETRRAMPNAALQPPVYTTVPYQYVSDFAQVPTAFIPNGTPLCVPSSSAFEFCVPVMRYQPLDPGWHCQDMPSHQPFTQGNQNYDDLPNEPALGDDGSATMSSPHSDIPLPGDIPFSGFDGVPYQHQHYHDLSFIDFPLIAMDDNGFPVYQPMEEFLQLGDDSDHQYSPVIPFCMCPEWPDSSQSSVDSLSSIQDEPYQMIHPVLPVESDYFRHEFTEEYSTTPPSGPSRNSSRSSRTGETRNTGGRSGPLDPSAREQASKTRQIGACRRCSWQKNKCEPGPDGTNGPCLPCFKILTNDSKKVVHRLPCNRSKLTDAVMFRTGGLNFTKRRGWEGAAMMDMRPDDWADDSIITIRLTLGYCDQPIELQVRRFVPQEGVDMISRFWLDPHGRQQTTKIAPYALHNIKAHRAVLVSHVMANAFQAIKRYAENKTVHPIVTETYKVAWDHMRAVDYQSPSSKVKAKEFMEDLFKLWFAMKNTLGSAWLLGDPGQRETLYMSPDERDGHPFPDKISAPRLVCQQFDAINYCSMLNPWRTAFFKKLDQIMAAKIDPKMLYTVYLAIFILLHEVSNTSKDRYWHARHKKDVQRRYDMELFMEQLHDGANQLLYAWHYYKCGFNPLDANPNDANPLDADWVKVTDERTTDIFNHMTTDQARVMVHHAKESSNGTVPETRAERKGWNGLVFNPQEKSPLIWERDMHFVSQMFNDDWQHSRVWSRAIDHGQPQRL